MNIPLLDEETENHQETSERHARMISDTSRLFWILVLSYMLFKVIVLTVRRKYIPFEPERLMGKWKKGFRLFQECWCSLACSTRSKGNRIKDEWVQTLTPTTFRGQRHLVSLLLESFLHANIQQTEITLLT